MEYVPFFIKVEGQPFSNHRNPAGVFKVDVKPEKSVAHSAMAAIQVARDAVPFLNENSDSFTLRAFSADGSEVVIPRSLTTMFEDSGCFLGRAVDHPENITVQ